MALHSSMFPTIKLELQTLRLTTLQALQDTHGEIQRLVELELKKVLDEVYLAELIKSEVRKAIAEEVPKVVRGAISTALWKASHEDTELARHVRYAIDQVVHKMGGGSPS